jgi:hypothetical protein
MPKYYINFNKVPNGKVIVDAKNEKAAIEKAFQKLSASAQEVIEWCENEKVSGPMIAVSISETGFVDFPEKISEGQNDNHTPEW